MHVTLVHVRVKPAHVEEFMAATRANHLASIQEPGNVRFDVLRMTDEPTHFILYEVFKDAAAAAAHKQTAHYLTWRDTVADWMASPREGVAHQMIFPE